LFGKLTRHVSIETETMGSIADVEKEGGRGRRIGRGLGGNKFRNNIIKRKTISPL